MQILIQLDSPDKTPQEIGENVVKFAIKAAVTSAISAFMGEAIGGIDPKSGKLVGAVADAANGLMSKRTLGFAEGLKAFFGAIDDAANCAIN